jgi:hypothetical protein
VGKAREQVVARKVEWAELETQVLLIMVLNQDRALKVATQEEAEALVQATPADLEMIAQKAAKAECNNDCYCQKNYWL